MVKRKDTSKDMDLIGTLRKDFKKLTNELQNAMIRKDQKNIVDKMVINLKKRKKITKRLSGFDLW